MQTIQLADYRIQIGAIKSSLSTFLKQNVFSKTIILTDENTQNYCLPLLKTVLPLDFQTIIIPSGEQHKNLDTCQIIWNSLFEAGADRKSLLINLGGGVIGDMGGFCASTFKRGMPFLQIPTTLLSQVDASIGGKLGIDFGNVKNSIGMFGNPKTVLIDPIFLKTLSTREIRSGFAELFKHALIHKATFAIQDLLNAFEQKEANLASIIGDSLLVKKHFVEKDPFEKGIRKALNFGHTIGHAVESAALESHEPLLHGEAIAIGMVCEAFLSHQMAGLSNADLDLIVHTFSKIYPKIDLENFDYQHLISLMQQDKKNDGNAINFTLLTKIGSASVNHIADEAQIIESLEFYQLQAV
ncbi:MAG: 3-dehydroquinate synthase [Bacteroidota bacterium]